MKRKHKRNGNQLIIGIVILVLAVTVFTIAIFENGDESKADDRYGGIGKPAGQNESIDEEKCKLSLIMIDVGEGLSCLVDYGDFEILYDGGYRKTSKKVLDTIEGYIDGNLEYIICSHPHADHAGGLTEVLNSYCVDKVIVCGQEPEDSSETTEFYKAIANEPGCRIIDDSDTTISLGDDAQMEIVEAMDPGDGDYDGDGITDNINDLSVVAYITYGSHSILLEGDLEEEGEGYLSGLFNDITFVAAGHHGSSTSNTLLNEWKPEVFAISCAKENEYNHPSKKVVTEALALSSDVYGTYLNGNIIFETDGEEYSVKAAKGESLTLD